MVYVKLLDLRSKMVKGEKGEASVKSGTPSVHSVVIHVCGTYKPQYTSYFLLIDAGKNYIQKHVRRNT
jgi:hypothetical protein